MSVLALIGQDYTGKRESKKDRHILFTMLPVYYFTDQDRTIFSGF